MNDKTLKITDVAERLGVSIGCIYRLCQDNALRHLRIGVGRGTIRILESDLEEFIEQSRAGPPSRPRPRGVRPAV